MRSRSNALVRMRNVATAPRRLLTYPRWSGSGRLSVVSGQCQWSVAVTTPGFLRSCGVGCAGAVLRTGPWERWRCQIQSDRVCVVLVICVLEVPRVFAVVLGVMMCLSCSVPRVQEVLGVEKVHPRRCRCVLSVGSVARTALKSVHTRCHNLGLCSRSTCYSQKPSLAPM